MIRRIFTLIVTFVLFACSIPMDGIKVFAADEAVFSGEKPRHTINLGATMLRSQQTSTVLGDEYAPGTFGTADKVYFGKYDEQPLAWRVIHMDNMKNQVLLQTHKNLGEDGGDYPRRVFSTEGSYSWKDSSLRKWLVGETGYDVQTYGQAFTDGKNFSVNDKKLIQNITVTSDTDSKDSVAQQPFYMLSTQDLLNPTYGFQADKKALDPNRQPDTGAGNTTGANHYYWTRTKPTDGDTIDLIYDCGALDSASPDTDGMGVRPATNLDVNKIMFTTKATGDPKGGQLEEIDPASNLGEDYIWRLTLEDEGQKVTVADVKLDKGKYIFKYTYAKTGSIDATHLSAIVTKGGTAKTGTLVSYQTLRRGPQPSGSASVTLPNGFDAAKDHVYVFSENRATNAASDYASAFAEVVVSGPTMSMVTLPGQLEETKIQDKTFTVVMPDTAYALDGSLKLAAKLQYKEYTSVTVDGVPQTDDSINDFSKDVTYSCVADNVTDTYVVRVKQVKADNKITDFTIPNQEGTTLINDIKHEIEVTMPYRTNRKALTPTVTLSQYASVSPASGVVQDFSQPVDYAVTSGDGNTQVYHVKVANVVSPQKVNLGTDMLKGGQQSNVYVGRSKTVNNNVGIDGVGTTYDAEAAIKWRILDINNEKTLLFSDKMVENSQIHSKDVKIPWEETDLNQWLNTTFLKGAFPDQAQSALLTYDSAVSNDKVSLLSAKELRNKQYFQDNNAGKVVPAHPCWLLGRGDWADYIASAGGLGNEGNFSHVYMGIRPTVYLNTSSIVLTTMEDIDKTEYLEVAAAAQDNKDWNLTIKDGNEAFDVKIPGFGKRGEPLNLTGIVNHSQGATQVSAMLLNEYGELLYYGKIAKSGVSEASIPLAAEFPMGRYTLKVFSETVYDTPNTPNTVDYASNIITKDLTIADKSDEKEIVTFTIPEQVGETTIDREKNVINIIVPYGTSLNSLTPSLTISDQAIVYPQMGASQDFRQPVDYTVKAEDETMQDYTVIVTHAKNTQKQILQFDIDNQVGTTVIDETAHSIQVVMPYGTDKSALAPNIVISPEAVVAPGYTVATDFTNEVTYTVTAQDGTTQDYAVTVENEKNTEKQILTFDILNQVGTTVIDETTHSIQIVMPYGTDKSTLTPILTISPDAAVSPASAIATDFTNDVTYTVTAEDGSTQEYQVEVKIAKNTEARILTFKIPNQVGQTVIDENNHTIKVIMPFGTDKSSLTPSITISPEAEVRPGSMTANDFTNVVLYHVTAQDGVNQQDYSVEVEVLPEEVLPDVVLVVVGTDTWVRGTTSGLTFMANTELSHFIDVSIDGTLLDAKHSNVKAGSIIIVLKPSYLATLTSGRHMITANTALGRASTFFFIKDAKKVESLNQDNQNQNTRESSKVPLTGDAMNVFIWLFIAFGAVALSLKVSRRKNQ